MQGLIDRYLASRALSESPAQGLHLDEDSLTAFAEGRLSDREAKPMITHLVDCTFCLHVTAELVRLDLHFAPEIEPARALVQSAEPSKVSEVLSRLLSRIFGTSDGAVLAYDDKEKKDEEKSEKPEEEKK